MAFGLKFFSKTGFWYNVFGMHWIQTGIYGIGKSKSENLEVENYKHGWIRR